MSEQVHPIFAVRGALEDHQHLSTWSPASPWPDAEVAFHWTNFDYPRHHIHEYWEILVLISGSLQHEINGKTTILKQHHACLLRPEDCHKHSRISDSVILLNMMAKKKYVDHIFSIYGDSTRSKLLDSDDLSFVVSEATLNRCVTDTQALQIDNSLSLGEKVDRCKILFAALMSELMMQNISNSNSHPEWLSKFLLKLSQSDLSNISIKADWITETGYSYSRLIYLFKKHMGCTISQYISHLRVERAKEYLKYSNMRIIDVAAAVGCDNVTHFNRIFKSATGATPSDFRKNTTRLSDNQKEGRKETVTKISEN